MADLPVAWSPAYEVDIGAHVFPTRKYRLVRERLLERGGGRYAFEEPIPADDSQLLLAHTPGYVRKIAEDDFTLAERMQLEVPFSVDLVNAMRLCCGGTVLTARRALEHGVAVHLGGGFHHAFADHGEGFCLVNDVAVAAAALLADGSARRIAVVDLDVHHGNGTAAIFAGDKRVTTFSMHQENNYPAVKPPSDLDVGLPDGTPDDVYLGLLRQHLPQLLASRPDLVLYLAGADPYREDMLGGLALTLEGLRERDRLVFAEARAAGAGVAVTLAGGYARDTDDTVSIHVATVEEAARAVRSSKPGQYE